MEQQSAVEQTARDGDMEQQPTPNQATAAMGQRSAVKPPEATDGDMEQQQLAMKQTVAAMGQQSAVQQRISDYRGIIINSKMWPRLPRLPRPRYLACLVP